MSGGAAQWGTLFSFDLATGAEQVLYAFQGGADGGNPMGGLIERGGMLYGTAMSGGSQACSFGCGVIYALDRGTGAMKAVYSFQSGNDGAFPNAGLAEAGGLLFGTTLSGGAGDAGTVFSVNPATGAERKRHDFDRQGDGTNPVSALTNVGGTLYGATVEGGSANQGVIFAIDRRTGAERVVQSFVRTNGTGPEGGVVEAGGKLYGTASEGGSGNDGVVFEAGPRQGAGKILHSFAGSDGAAPWAGLVQVGDRFYGTTSGGGAAGAGVIFAVTP